MADQLVLVTGAAGGKQGRTGRHVCEMLRARGVRVRALVRKIDERCERLRELGAELFVGDLLDIRSVQRAVEGVSSVYFAYPVQDGLLDATANMAVAAREAGVSRLVNLVMLFSAPDAPTPRMRQNYVSERIFEWAGIGAAHIRACVFFENLRFMVGLAMAAEGVFRLPLGNDSTEIPLVAGEDVARVAVGVLTSAAVQPGAGYRVVGVIHTVREIIESFGRVLGRDVVYERISDEAWQSDAVSRGFNTHVVAHLSALWRQLRMLGVLPHATKFEVTDTIEKLGGAKPKTFEEFVREEQKALAAQTAERVA